MTKVIIRETIIALLVCLAVLIILSIVLYNYIPSNKVIPESVEYTPSREIQSQLNAAVEDNSDEIIMTYEITANDLDKFERTNEYNPGKVNPFAAYSETPDVGDGNTSTGNSDGTGNTTTGQDNTISGGSNTGGTLWENGSSK